MIYQFSVGFLSTKTMGIIKIHFGHCVGKYGPGTFVPGSARCRSALCFSDFYSRGPSAFGQVENKSGHRSGCFAPGQNGPTTGGDTNHKVTFQLKWSMYSAMTYSV